MSQSYQNTATFARQSQKNSAALLQDFDLTQLYHPDYSIGDFALCSLKSDDGEAKFRQSFFGVKAREQAEALITKTKDSSRHHWWQSQASFRPNIFSRRIPALLSFNSIWVDIDLEHPPADFDKSLLPAIGQKGFDYYSLAQLLVLQMVDDGLPDPTCIIQTGGGLCARIELDVPVPAMARARWQALENNFIERIANLRGDRTEDGRHAVWPVDRKASDAVRILRVPGTYNPKRQNDCKIVYTSGKKYSFDVLAEYLLPYTNAEYAAFLNDKKTWQKWDKNRLKAAAAGIRPASVKPGVAIATSSSTTIDWTEQNKTAQIVDEGLKSMWTGRFDFAIKLLEHRGGKVQVGNRNAYFWPLANALAYSCGKADDIKGELLSLHETYFKHDDWTPAEALSSAASVLKRASTATLYRMRTETFYKALEATPSELRLLGDLSGPNANRNEWDVGVMGFEKMQNLDYSAYIKETRRRQGEAGKRSAEVRTVHGRALPAELKDKAVLMRNSGCTQAQIATELNISRMTLSRWISTD